MVTKPMTAKNLTLTAAAALIVAACATPTPYQPAEKSRDGYTNRSIENDRLRVTFHGNSRTSRETVESYLLFRAAELTLEKGGDYFVVVDRDTEKNTDFSTTGFNGGFVGPGLYPYGGFAYGAGFGLGGGTSSRTRAIPRYSAQAEILVRQGERPDDVPSAFDARQVIENLGPTVLRPEEKA